MKKALLLTIFTYITSPSTFAMEKETPQISPTQDLFAQLPKELHKEFIINMLATQPSAIENLKTLQKLMLTSKAKAQLKTLFANQNNVIEFCLALKNSTENIFRSLYLLKVYKFITKDQYLELYDQFKEKFPEEFKAHQNDEKQFIKDCVNIRGGWIEYPLEKLRYWFNKGININTQAEIGSNALITAAYRLNVEAVRLLLSSPEVDVNKQDFVGMTALMQTVRWKIYQNTNHIEIIKLLLSAPDINVNIQDNDKNYGFTALMLASINGSHEIVKLLLNVPGIDLTIKDNHGKTALDLAKTEEIKKILQDFINKKNVQQEQDTYLDVQEWIKKNVPYWRKK